MKMHILLSLGMVIITTACGGESQKRNPLSGQNTDPAPAGDQNTSAKIKTNKDKSENNKSPVIQTINAKSVKAGEFFTLEVSASDLDNDEIKSITFTTEKNVILQVDMNPKAPIATITVPANTKAQTVKATIVCSDVRGAESKPITFPIIISASAAGDAGVVKPPDECKTVKDFTTNPKCSAPVETPEPK